MANKSYLKESQFFKPVLLYMDTYICECKYFVPEMNLV